LIQVCDCAGRIEALALAISTVRITLILVVAMLVRESLPGGHPLATLRATTDVSSGRPGDRAAMMRLMEQDVMVFARRTLGPLKGGADRISCATCHGRDGAAHEWKMPAVQALPEPELRTAGLELYNADVDAQVRNAAVVPVDRAK
jgi:cytochrome c553